MPAIKIASAPAPIAPIDRAQLATDIQAARALADRLVETVVREGVGREIGLAISARLNEQAAALVEALELGASDFEIAPAAERLAALVANGDTVANDPRGMVARHDRLATGRTDAPPPLGEVEASAPQ